MCAAHKERPLSTVAGTTRPPALDRQSALFIDVDGTLLEIARRPESVQVPPPLLDLLGQLAGERDGALALISGRSIADLDRLFQPWRGAAAGLHGAERRRPDGSHVVESDSAADSAAAAALDRLRPELAALTARFAGVWLEDKGRTLALHYRAVPDAGPALRASAEQLLGGGSSLRLIAGKMVVELQPQHHGKGRAIAGFMKEAPFRGRMPVYLGDDTTDEDGFAEVNRRGGLSIRVGLPDPATVAVFALSSVAAARDWLAGSAT
jgi:trehalose 6-phosphate phosphatase